MDTLKENKLFSFLTFQLDDETFAVDVGNVTEILDMQKITRIPKTPEYLCGVINLRGNVIPIIDLRQKMSKTVNPNTLRTAIIVLQLNLKNKLRTIGAIADMVSDVVQIQAHTIKPLPDLGSKYNPDFVQGMVKIGEKFIMLLNIEKVL